MLRLDLQSYKSLPIRLHQIQWKFRDELRPKSGLMRAREFLMSDAYSFDIDADAAKSSYNLFYKIYMDFFQEIGLKVIPAKADSGPIGGDLSHEFILLCDSGESEVVYEQQCMTLIDDYYRTKDIDVLNKLFNSYAATSDVVVDKEPDVEGLLRAKGIEVGHVFYFGEKYSLPMGAKIADASGKIVNLHMGSYGIGVSRLVAAIAEICNDERGIKWPESIAPFEYSIILLKGGDSSVSEKLYSYLDAKTNVIYDDSLESNGTKFARIDLLGAPRQIVVGPKNSPNCFEVIERSKGTLHHDYDFEKFVSDFFSKKDC